jgi:hypothetical protein
MYRSELEAEKMKRRMQALSRPGRALIPDILMATTKGEAAADVDALLANASSVELYLPNVSRCQLAMVSVLRTVQSCPAEEH